MDDPKRKKAFERFHALYEKLRGTGTELVDAARWIQDRYAPYQPGESVHCPRDGTASSGKLITVTSVRLHGDPNTGDLYWAVCGDGGYFRIRIDQQDIPAASQKPRQDDLF